MVSQGIEPPENIPAPLLDAPPARCLTCFYIIEALPLSRCPECGRSFDLNDATTFTRKPPFVWWRIWLPGFALSVILGAVAWAVLLTIGGIGWAVTLAVPLMIGVVLGYVCRLSLAAKIFGGLLALISVIAPLVFMHVIGLLCGLIALVVTGPSVILGAAAGWELRHRLKRISYSHRSYLPVIILFLLVVIGGIIESAVGWRSPPESIVTTQVIEVDQEIAWRRLAFYEECDGPKPWLLQVAGPVPVTIRHSADGATHTCLYKKGRIVKHVTRMEAPHRLEFDVVDHDIGEEHSVQLLDGSFDFEKASDTRTTVRLTTRYQPKLRPRLLWRPFEILVCGQVHEHVLNHLQRPSPVESALAGEWGTPP